MRTQPHSHEAEADVLGAVLLRPEVLPRAQAVVTAEDFYHPAHRAVWEAVCDVDSRHEPIETTTVLEALRRLDLEVRLKAVGGADFLVELMGTVVSPELVEVAARIVAAKADRRRSLSALFDLTQAGLDPQLDDADFAAQVENSLLELATRRRLGTKGVILRKLLHSTITEVGERHKRFAELGKSKPIGVVTGFSELDAFTAGLRAGQLVILAGRPGSGKTAFGMNAVVGAAKAGFPVYVLSAEMTAGELTERVLSAEGAINAQKLRSGDMNVVDWDRLSRAASNLSELPVTIDDDGDATIGAVRARVRRWRSTVAKDAEQALVVVDYLQLLKPVEDDERRLANREQEVARISRGLKALAKECRCPVVALAQLNRGVETRTDKRPTLADLRDSGAIEQDADIVLLMYRDGYYDNSPDNPHRDYAELEIAKHRGGPLAMCWLHWDAKYTRFRTAEEAPPPKGKRKNA